jgi:tetratricopeptide (TPR) repeat protein
MKKIYILTLVLGLAACNKELDVKPQQSLDQSLALSSDANIKKVLLGAYDGISGFSQSLGTYGFLWGGDILMFSELLAADGEISWVGTYNQPREVFGKKILTNNSFVRANWTGGYYTINICNNILENIDKVKTADQDRVKGEALFIRGAVYFELVRFFGKPYSAGNTSTNLAVPIVLKGTQKIDADSFVKRATVEEVYQQVLSDLNQAEALLPDENDVYANKSAAAAILSRVYLGMADYANARDAANRVIQSDLYALTPTIEEAFNNASNSTEDIFAIQENELDGVNDMQVYWSTSVYGARDGDVQINDKHLTYYEAGDERLNLFFDSNGARRTLKWQQQYKVLPIVRLAEMYLTRAECNLRLNTAVGDTPANDLNLIRDRVGLGPIAAPTLADILHERKVELAFEGSAVHDLKRLKLSADGYAYDANAMVFPIPAREISANANLVQNDGYSDN